MRFAMSSCMEADDTRREADEVRLAGSVTLPVLFPVLTEIWRTARRNPGASFRIDCSGVTKFSSPALAELVKLRRDLRGHGGDLVLAKVCQEVWDCLRDLQFKSLVERGRPMRRQKQGLQGPHQPRVPKWKPAKPKAKQPREPYFLSLRGTRYQRYWLN
jgi:ABC-type transporter Mla MlaB component